MLGLEHYVRASEFAERDVRWSDFTRPEEYVRTIAVGKVLAARDQLAPEESSATTIVTGDLTVFLNGQAYGKPNTFDQARSYLHLLQNQTHLEVAAVCVWSANVGLTEVATQTLVTLPPLTEADITAYLQQANPLTKAGGFDLHTLQHMLLKRGQSVTIEGELSTILGLPVLATVNLLNQHGWVPPVSAATLEQSLRQEVSL
jgi:septum formation protein